MAYMMFVAYHVYIDLVPSKLLSVLQQGLSYYKQVRKEVRIIMLL